MNNHTKERIKNQLRIHWHWLKETDHENVAKFIIATIERSEIDNKK